MSLTLQRAQIVRMLQSVSGIGMVHDRERWATDWSKFLAVFTDPVSHKILGWTITREATPSTWYTSGQAEDSHLWVVRGYAGLSDADDSESAFQDLVETVRATLRHDPTLGGTAEGISGPPAVRLFQPRLFGGVLCHYVEITFIAKEVVDC